MNVVSSGDVIAQINDKSGNGNHAVQATFSQRPVFFEAENGDRVLQNDEIDDALTVTFPDMGSDCTIAYVTQSEVRFYEAQSLNGVYTLPQHDLLGFVAVDRALTKQEKIRTIQYLASKAQGVSYGASIDDMVLACMNAVDVFVYDTTKDSDGGAWRTGALAQASSWYNETLNTATRGSRREFPAVAVIVAEATKVTIYDGDDPTLPMWMVFGLGSNSFIYLGPTTAVAMFNGILAVGVAGAGGGLSLVGFPQDKSLVSLDYSSNNFAILGVGIAGRNGSGSRVTGANQYYSSGIVNRTVNDVAMTVLPDAPIDPATGLPVPTIAVATDGGVSVIRDDGAVVDVTSQVGFSGVDFFETDRIAAYQQGTKDVLTFSIPTSDASVTSSGVYSGGVSDGRLYRENIAPPVMATNSYLPTETELLPTGVGDQLAFAWREVGGSEGFGVLKEAPDQANGMVRKVTSTYNTGWMNGDIKGAFLADTDDTDLVGEPVTNGGFDTDSDWTKQAGWTISGGTANVDSSIAGTTNIMSATTVPEVGKTYLVEYEIVSVSGSGVRASLGGAQERSYNSASGSVSMLLTATTTDVLAITAANSDTVASIDNVSVKLVDEDRSVNNNGLIVNGTITRSPVADGAELVAYSGFSAANYLEQPYNSALDFGTGDFCVMGWSKGARSIHPMFSKNNGSAYSIIFGGYSSTAFWFGTKDGSGTSLIIATSSRYSNVWNHHCGVRKNGVMYLYENGVLIGTSSNTARNVTQANDVLAIGYDASGSGGNSGSNLYALFRISGTAPTADQIKKIYEDEKVLFQENAACTLYGTSDAVTALAHDPDTDLLHVGTSAGRSVFRGLERIQNTTTSVSKAISAVGGLIAEK